MRTVEDILDEMDEMKKRRVEMGAFELARLKKLENQIRSMVSKSSQK